MSTYAERFGRLRSLLHEAPDAARWAELGALLRAWDADTLEDEILPYVRGFYRKEGWAEVADGSMAWVAPGVDGAPPRAALLDLIRRFVVKVTPADASALAAVRGASWASLEVLRLFVTGEHEARMDWAEVSRWMPVPAKPLEQLEIINTAFGADDIIAMLDAMPGDPEHLTVAHTEKVWSSTLIALMQRASPRLRVVDLSRTKVDEREDGALLPEVNATPTLRVLKLGRTLCEPPFGSQLAACASLAGLHTLDVSDNLLERICFHEIANSPHWTLRHFRGNQNRPDDGPGTMEALAQGGALTRLESLDMSDNSLTDEALTPLADARWLGTLRHLNLGVNSAVHDQGVEALAALPFQHLETLHLHRCHYASVEPLLASPHLATLRHLDLSGGPHLISNGDRSLLRQLDSCAWLGHLDVLDLRGRIPRDEQDSLRDLLARRFPNLTAHLGPVDEEDVRFPYDPESWPQPDEQLITWTRGEVLRDPKDAQEEPVAEEEE